MAPQPEPMALFAKMETNPTDELAAEFAQAVREFSEDALAEAKLWKTLKAALIGGTVVQKKAACMVIGALACDAENAFTQKLVSFTHLALPLIGGDSKQVSAAASNAMQAVVVRAAKIPDAAFALIHELLECVEASTDEALQYTALGTIAFLAETSPTAWNAAKPSILSATVKLLQKRAEAEAEAKKAQDGPKAKPKAQQKGEEEVKARVEGNVSVECYTVDRETKDRMEKAGVLKKIGPGMYTLDLDALKEFEKADEPEKEEEEEDNALEGTIELVASNQEEGWGLYGIRRSGGEAMDTEQPKEQLSSEVLSALRQTSVALRKWQETRMQQPIIDLQRKQSYLKNMKFTGSHRSINMAARFFRK